MPSSEYQTLWQAVQAQWHDIVLTVSVAMVSGTAAYLSKMNKHRPRLFSLIEFVADNLAAAVAGFIALMICLEMHLSPWMTGAVVGIVGHSAPRFLFLADKWMLNRAKIHLDVDENNDRP